MARRRTALAVIASVLLHLGLLLLVLRLRPLPSLEPAVPRPEWVEVEIGGSPGTGRTSVAAFHGADAPRLARPTSANKPAHSSTGQKRRSVQPQGEKASEKSLSLGGSSGAPPLTLPSLEQGVPVPDLRGTLPSWGVLGEAPSGPGTGSYTLRNEPGSMPDAQALAQEDARRVNDRVQGWIADEQAQERVANGLVDDYFRKLKHGLEKAVEDPPEKDRPDQLKRAASETAKTMLKAYKDSLRRYGDTGNPYAEGEAVAGRDETVNPSPMTKAAGLGPSGKGGKNSGAQSFADFLNRGRMFLDFADARFSQGMVALVEIHQHADGKFQSTLLVRSSGNGAFDGFVLGAAPRALEKLSPPPAEGLGIHPNGVRSLWAFEGKIVFSKPLKEYDLKKDWWYLGAMALPGLAVGHFDETTGEVDLVDIRDPKFVYKVRLLSVY